VVALRSDCRSTNIRGPDLTAYRKKLPRWSARKHISQYRRILRAPPGSAVITGEFHWRRAEPLGQRDAGPMGELAAGGGAGPDDHPGRARVSAATSRIAATSSARRSGVESRAGSSTGLPPMPRGSVVTTVWSPASACASGMKSAAGIGEPRCKRSGPSPRTS